MKIDVSKTCAETISKKRERERERENENRYRRLEVAFPYPSMYKEQLQYVRELKRLWMGGHGLLEMPAGIFCRRRFSLFKAIIQTYRKTGKTVALLSLILAYRAEYPAKIGKLIYCTRTVPEMGQVINDSRRSLSTESDWG